MARWLISDAVFPYGIAVIVLLSTVTGAGLGWLAASLAERWQKRPRQEPIAWEAMD